MRRPRTDSTAADPREGRRRRSATGVAVAAALAGAVGGLPAAGAPSDAGPAALVAVVVDAVPGHVGDAEAAVAAAGGTIGIELPVIDGFAADVPAPALADLAGLDVVESIVPDGRLRLHGHDDAAPSGRALEVVDVAELIGADRLWADGVIGQGVDVAVIDSGVAPVPGLLRPGQVVLGPDLSFESQVEELRHLDTFGHGTHLAGIVSGLAPGTRIVSVKVADSLGNTDVSQVIAAIGWVVDHRASDGLDIRVLNLAFGTDGGQDRLLDPLAAAVESAWANGIVVVAAAGNRPELGRLDSPASDPTILAVSASDGDAVPEWASTGDGRRDPDVVAPGRSVASLRVPGSSIDEGHQLARVGESSFLASGTSVSTAVTSGAVALLLARRPSLSPDEVKDLLRRTAVPLPGVPTARQGRGRVDIAAASAAPALPTALQVRPQAWGGGPLDGARGTMRVHDDGLALAGDVDIFGRPWRGGADLATGWWDEQPWGDGSVPAWEAPAWEAPSWAGRPWAVTTDRRWSGGGWVGAAWSRRFSGPDGWTGNSWSGNSWSQEWAFVEDRR